METKNNTQIETTNVAKTNTKNAGKTPKESLWKNVLVGGVPGILIGGAGMFAAEEILHADPKDGDVTEPLPYEEDQILEAHSVNDAMSFDQAFAAARSEVGPGGAFVWHGHVYGTYMANDLDWVNMTADMRNAHSELILSQVHPTPYYSATPEPPVVEVPEEPVVVEEPIQAEEPVQAEEASELYVYGVETVENEDGETINVAYGTYGDHMMTMIDTDNDQIMDTLVVDDNNNLMTDNGEDLQLAGPGASGDPSDAADLSDLL